MHARVAASTVSARVLFHERRHELVEQSEHVVTHEHLSVAVRPRSDADGGDSNMCRGGSGNVGRDGFQHNRKRSGRFEGRSIGEQLGIDDKLITTSAKSGLGIKELWTEIMKRLKDQASAE
jgi:hypothetical protein